MMAIVNYIKQNYWLLLILAFAAFLRFFKLDFQSLWMDEIYTMNVSSPSLSLKQIHDEVVVKEGFPYLYFYLLHGLYSIFGYSGVVARSLSAVAGVAGVYAIYVFVKHIFNKNVAILAAFLLAVNEFHIQYSQEARPYTLFVLVTIICFYRLSVFVKASGLKNAIWYGLSLALMLNINFFAFITVFAQVLLLVLLLVFSPKEQKLQLFLHSALAGMIGLILFAPNYEIFQKLLNFQSFWVPAPQPNSFTIMFKELMGNSEVTCFIFMLLFTYYGIRLFKEKVTPLSLNSVKASPVNYSFVLLFFWFTGFFAVLYTKSFMGTSLVLNRYFITLLPVFIIVLAISLYLIKNKLASAAIILAVAIFSYVNLVIVQQFYSIPHKSQYRETAALINKNNSQHQTVFTSLKYWYDYYLNTAIVKNTVVERTLEDQVKLMMADSLQRKPFWYADAHVRPYNVTVSAQEYLDKYFILKDNFDGFDAWTKHYVLKSKESQKVDIKKFAALQTRNGDAVQYSLEIFEHTDNMLTASGWIYFPFQDATTANIKLVLIKNGEALALQTQKVSRPDVAPYFKLDNKLDNSGFKCRQTLIDVAKGTYTFGIYVADKTTGKEALVVTDKTIDIK